MLIAAKTSIYSVRLKTTGVVPPGAYADLEGEFSSVRAVRKDFEKVGNMIADVLDSLLLEDKERLEICKNIKNQVIEMCSNYPIYKEPY